MEEKAYRDAMIMYPENGKDPFSYEKGDKPYFLWLTNRQVSCSMLGDEEILKMPNMWYKGEIKFPEFDMGYTNLCQFERLFLIGADNKSNVCEVLYCKEDIKEDEQMADFLLFAYADGEKTRISTSSNTVSREKIKEVSKNEVYSVSNAKEIINLMQHNEEEIYACVGVRLIENLYWH